MAPAPVAAPPAPVAAPPAPVAAPPAPVAAPPAPVAAPPAPPAPVAAPPAPVAAPPAPVAKKLNRAKKIEAEKLRLRAKLWPGLDEGTLWHRRTHQGYTTIPRCMPHIAQILDGLSNGNPISATYFALWCHLFEESFITIKNPREMAFEAGYFGQRAETTWKGKMKKLAELGFIKAKAGAGGPYTNVLVLNPYQVIEKIHKEAPSSIREDLYDSLLERASEIGEKGLLD